MVYCTRPLQQLGFPSHGEAATRPAFVNILSSIAPIYNRLTTRCWILCWSTGTRQALDSTRWSILVENGFTSTMTIRLSLSESTGWARTIPTFVSYLRHIHNLAHLPNMVLPLNPADEPLAAIKDGEQPRPLLAFCKTPQFSDVLIPNTAEGDSA